jgi:hypothetical protein
VNEYRDQNQQSEEREAEELLGPASHEPYSRSTPR